MSSTYYLLHAVINNGRLQILGGYYYFAIKNIAVTIVGRLLLRHGHYYRYYGRILDSNLARNSLRNEPHISAFPSFSYYDGNQG